jgi:hypothetical protein
MLKKHGLLRRVFAVVILQFYFVRALPADWKVLPGHVPSVVSNLTPEGLLPGTNQLQLSIGLPLRDQAGLESFLTQVSDPASPNFRRFLSLQELTARFGPTEQDYNAAKAFAQSHGLTVTTTYDNRLVLGVSGPASAVQAAFHVTLRTYRHPTEERDFFAPDTDPTVDASLAVADIQGLSDFSRPHPMLHRADVSLVSNVAPKGGSAPNGTGAYFGNDFRSAYAPDTTLTGTGQIVGLLEFDGYYASDIAAYAAAAGDGRSSIPIQAVLVDGVSGTPGYSGISGANDEVSLDIEMAIAMAPGLAGVQVFEGSSQNDVLNSMLSAGNTVKNLSSSWGWGGGPSTTTDNIFKSMAAIGQSFFNAAGDSDAFTSGVNSANSVDKTSLENAPASSPYITQVGGTTLTTGANAAYASETVWNWGYVSSVRKYVGGSGGISSYYSIPSWQTSITNLAACGGSTSFRNIPDVALTADNIYVDFGNGSSGTFGGTSCAAPLWAAFTALVNQQAAAVGNPPAGFVNPALYTIAGGSGYAACFHDITTGNNTSSSSPNLFYATNGYDLCTGLGTPAGQSLINGLAGPAAALIVSPLSIAATGVAGGPFNLTQGFFTLTNTTGSPLVWLVSGLPAWLTLSATNGTLGPSAQTNLTCTLTTTASNLALGTYSANLSFSNVTAQSAQTGLFTLQVNQPLIVSPTNGFAASGPAGGAFSLTSQIYSLTNQSVGSLSWSIVNLPSWLGASPSSGVLAGGSQTSVSLGLTKSANSLATGSYTATVLVTNATGLAASLPCTLQVSQPLAVSPASGFTASGPVGGAFNTNSQNFTLSNDSASSLPWSIVNLPSWLGASPASGTLAGAAQTTVTLGLTPTANSLAAGVYSATVLVTNFAGLAASLPFTIRVGQSIVSNGGFETGSFSGWTLNGNTVDDLVTASGSFVHSGNYGAELGQPNTLAYLYQTLATSPGQYYLLSLWLDNPNNSAGATPNQFQVQWNGTTLFNQTNIPFVAWTNLQFIVSATGASTVLQFGVYNTPSYFGLDDISAVPISPPVFRLTQPAPSQTANFNITWSAAAGMTYQVQYSTNLHQTNWINLGGPVAATTNTLTISDTNALLNSPQRFYRIVVLP